MAANDGQALAGQPTSVQQLFNSTYGANAGSVWDQQHNAAIGGGSASNYPTATVAPLNMPNYASLFAGIGNGTSAMTAATQRQAALLGFTPQPGKDRLSRSLAAIFQGEPSIQQADVNATGYDPTDYQTAVKNWIAATGSNADLTAVKKDPIAFAVKEGFLPPAPPRTVNDMMDQVVLDQLRQNGLMAPALETSLNAKLEAAYQADLTGKTAAQTNPADDPNSYQLDEATGMYVPKQNVLDAINQDNVAPTAPSASAGAKSAPGFARLADTRVATGAWGNTIYDASAPWMSDVNNPAVIRLAVSQYYGGGDNVALPDGRHLNQVSDQEMGQMLGKIRNGLDPISGQSFLNNVNDPAYQQALAAFQARTPTVAPTAMSTADFRTKFENQNGPNPLPPIPSTQMYNQTFNAADRAGVGQLFQGMGIDPSILSDQINKLAPPSGTTSLATPLFTSKGLAGVYG